MSALSRRPQYLWLAVIALLGLIGLSILVDSPAADAAPNVFAGLAVVAVAWLVVRDGLDRPIAVATAAALAVGGLGSVYEGLVDLGAVPSNEPVELLTEAFLLVGLGLFVYDRVLAPRL